MSASRALLLGLVAACAACSAQAQMRMAPASPNPVDGIRGSSEFEFYASLFPDAGASFAPGTDPVMSEGQLKAASNFLTEEFSVQKRTLRQQSESVWRAVERARVTPKQRTAVDGTHVTFKDDNLPWAHAVPPAEIVIGALTTRGLLLGGLRESATGTAGFSRFMGAYLGNTSQSHLSVSELEARARLFFAAAKRGVTVPRSDDDFDEHRRMAVTLIDQMRAAGGEAAVQAELERRLRAAAQGGEISGADGMAIFDVFSQLSSHVRPALVFVLSHELGHLALGHVPFPKDMTCAQKQQVEDDADAFAVALLVYNVPGESQTEAAALHNLGLTDPPGAADDTLEYGYTHAVRYGFTLAGMNNTLGPGCEYRGSEDRIAFLNALRSAFVARRIQAYEATFRYFREHPPYIYADRDVDAMPARERAAYARDLQARCRNSRPNAPPRGLRKLKELPFGWVASCGNSSDPRLSDPSFAADLGSQTAREFLKEYRTGMPAILSDTAIKALQSR